MADEENKPAKIRPGKLMALTLLLTVPVMMTGCSELADEEDCNPEIEECEYDDVDGIYKKKKKSSSVSSAASGSTKSHSGFGSGGGSGSGG